MLQAGNISAGEEGTQLIPARAVDNGVYNHRECFGRSEKVVEARIFAERGVVGVDGLEGFGRGEVEVVWAGPDYRSVFGMKTGELEGKSGSDAVVVNSVDAAASGKLRPWKVSKRMCVDSSDVFDSAAEEDRCKYDGDGVVKVNQDFAERVEERHAGQNVLTAS